MYGNDTVIFSKLGFLKCSCLSTISKITKEKEKCSWKVNVDKKKLVVEVVELSELDTYIYKSFVVD